MELRLLLQPLDTFVHEDLLAIGTFHVFGNTPHSAHILPGYYLHGSHLTSRTDLQPTVITAMKSPETSSDVHSPKNSETVAATPPPADLERCSSLKRKRVQDDQDNAAVSDE